MEKKDASLPKMYKTIATKEPLLSFKVRPTLRSKDNQIKIQKTILQAKAKNTIKKMKNFNSPELIFALNQSIRLETSLNQNQLIYRQPRQSNKQNKTFHTSNLSYSLQKITKNSINKKYYAVNQQRSKAIQLSNWINNKLALIKSKNSISLDDILQYNQTVVNFGLGEIIQSIRKKCKEQGDTLKNIWDNTFILFQNLLNILAEQLKKKDLQMIENQKKLEQIYLTNLSFINKKNQDLEKHLQLLYQKMKKVILWNRRLRKDRYKQEIQLRIRDYKLATYTSALEQTIGMLLAQSRQPNCLKLAKKITSKLYRQKITKNKRKNKNKLKQQAQSFMEDNARQFVTEWLRRYSFEDQQKIQNAVYLSQDQKLEIMKITDQNQADYVDIYDFFQTANYGTQTQNIKADRAVQYEQSFRYFKTRSVGIETKRIFTNSIGSQVTSQKQQQKPLQQQKSKGTGRGLLRKTTLHKKLKNKQNMVKKQSNQSNTFVNSSTTIKIKQRNEGSIHKSKKQVYLQQDNLQNLGSQFQDFITEDEQLLQFQSQMYTDDKNCSEDIKQNIQKGKNQYKKLRSLKLISQYDEIPLHTSTNLNQKNIKIRNKGKKNNILSQRYITEVQQNNFQNYLPKPLKHKKFEQIYQGQMKIQIQQNKQSLIRTVVRRRSFYKTNRSRQQKNQKQIMLLWYRRNKYPQSKPKKELNQIDQNIYNYFSLLSKNLNLPLNYSKSKTFQQTCTLFSTVSTNLNNVTKAVPKNKQFINLSVNSITKFISRLLFDYLRKIRSDFQGIYVQSQRVYYPLSVILVDHMMHKYGLRQIAEKKLKDFMEKVSNFVGISERINFFYRLFGVGQETMGADELIIYMKCLVYFDVGKVIPIMNFSKDFTVQRIVTDKETVLQQVDLIIKQFFRQNCRAQVKWKIQKYFHSYQLTGFFDIERIAVLLVDQFISIKKQKYEDYLPIYKNCQGNFFPNLLKLIEIFCSSQAIPSKYAKIIQQIFRNADLLDQNYGKSISELRFIGLCVKLGFPKFGQIKQKLKKLKIQLLKATNLGQQWSPQSEQSLNKIKKKYNIRVSVEKQAPDYWLLACAQVGYDVPLINTFNIIGNLKIIQNLKNISIN